MNIFYSFLILINLLHGYGYLSISPSSGLYYVLYGQVICHCSSQILNDFGNELIVDLQDLSITGPHTSIISQIRAQAIVFPITFNITYLLNDVEQGHIYSINAKIINENNIILFANDRRIEVKLLGIGRTTFVDIPVVPIRSLTNGSIRTLFLREWPELVGFRGVDAVEIIKKETGFEQVFTVTNETRITKDIRYDRVLVYVDKEGNVERTPIPG